MSPLRRLQLESTAFLLCDIQEKFRSLIYGFPHVVQTANKMIKASEILSIPLLVTEQYSARLGTTVAELDISKALIKHDKMRFSMLTPSIVEKIQALNLKSVVLFGIESHVCVTQTALDCLEKDITTYIVADGVSSMNPIEKKIAIERLRAAGAVISSSESILFELMRDATHPQFKLISNLVKESKSSTDAALKDLCT